MRSRNVSSSDLRLARTLSRRVRGRGQKAPGAAAPGSGGAGYTRFAPALEGMEPPPPPRSIEPEATSSDEAAGRPPAAPAVPLDMDSWEVLLAWSLELCQARAAFVVDPQGFVIASRGNVPTDGFDGTGAELAYGMEQLDRVDPEAGTLHGIELQFEGRKVFAVRGEAASGSYVLGFVGSRTMPEDLKVALHRQLVYSLQTLG